MAITLGSNIPAYNTRMQLNGVTDSLTETMRRLSTGQKINSAGDDAAGLVISENMDALIRGSKQAMTNIQTAQSFLNIAEDGMVSISEHFQRINDLLTNMANDTNDTSSRTAAVDEIIERLNEINRLAESTNFNGMKMLDGSSKSIIVQMGPDSDKTTSTLDISNALTDCHLSQFSAELPDNLNPNAYKNTYAAADGDTTSDVIIETTFNRNEYFMDEDGNVVKLKDSGDYVKVSDAGVETAYTVTGDLTEIKSGYTIKGSPDKIAVLNQAGNGYVTLGGTAYTVSANKESLFDPTNANCRKYMSTVQDAIAQLSTQRGLIGAYENRMQSSYDSLSTRIESLESAKVPYTDTDVASEATNLIQTQIMQQVNVAVLSNANTIQQLALSLLGG